MNVLFILERFTTCKYRKYRLGIGYDYDVISFYSNPKKFYSILKLEELIPFANILSHSSLES